MDCRRCTSHATDSPQFGRGRTALAGTAGARESQTRYVSDAAERRHDQEESIMKWLTCSLAIILAVAGAVVPLATAQDRTVGQRVDDAAITAAVKTKLSAD